MKALLDHRQGQHDPQHFLVRGRVQPCPEQPARIDALRQGALNAACEFETPSDHGMAPLARVHSTRYLHFLQNIHTALAPA